MAELEEKMRLIDPAFGKETSAQDLLRRLDQLEQKLNGVLAKREPTQPPSVVATVVPSAAAPAQTPSLVPVSVTGDYQKAPNGETRQIGRAHV